jgi:ABC-2 type transport system ATP-binding protein
MLMINTENLTKKFGELTAVDALNLNVKEGEIFGFLGPNGAGKTTTVRMLTCLIGPTAGKARVNGYPVGEEDMSIRRTVGILTETPGMYDNLSALRNLQIYASLYEVKDPAGQIEKYLRLFDLWDRKEDEAGTYSKGMKQKLAITRALLHEPRIVFLDEPTAGLDPEAARMIRDLIVDLKKQGRTVFLCTHNLDEADRLCDRIGVFKSRLVVVDTPARLRTELFGRKIVFHLRQADEDLAESIKQLDFVGDARVSDNRLVVNLQDPERYNPELVRVLVGMGADIQFVGELRRSLEDVYLQLVRNS